MADAAAGVGDVAGVARDNMKVELRHGLAGGGAIVEAKIEGVGRWRELRGQVLLGPINSTLKPTGSFRLGLGTGRSGCRWLFLG